MKMLFKGLKRKFGIQHPYEELKMGFINTYSLIISKSVLQTFKKDGWVEVPKFRRFHYEPKNNETVVLNRPLTLKDKGTDYLIGKMIQGHIGLGISGMGCPGFAGFLIKDIKEKMSEQYLVYAVIHADDYILFDGRPLTGINKYNPWMPEESELDFDNWSNNHKLFNSEIQGLIINDVFLFEDRLIIKLVGKGKVHILEFLKYDSRLSTTYSSGKIKSPAYKNGIIQDYLVFQHINAVLHT